jgi:16S rRNA (adenine1518-N6/adenine1519-N6)-dimethyltransferase
MDIYEEKPVKAGNEELLFGIIRGAFNQRRKTLVNALAGYAALDISKDRILEALEKTGEKPTVRGEELSLQKYTELTDALSD